MDFKQFTSADREYQLWYLYQLMGGSGTAGGASVITGLAPSPGTYDNIILAPPSKPTTITYKLGSTTVSTLTLTYSGEDVETITKS